VFATGEPDARIDYVFLGYRLTNEFAPRVRNAWRAGNEPIDGIWPSDHAAVVVELEMPGKVRGSSNDRGSSSDSSMRTDV
jgi:hypothetical protein